MKCFLTIGYIGAVPRSIKEEKSIAKLQCWCCRCLAACEEQGRIHYYLKNQDENAVIQEVNFWISWLEQRIAKENQINIDNLITTVFDEMLCME